MKRVTLRLQVYFSLVITILTIGISTSFLYLTIWEHGVRISPDSTAYLTTGYNFFSGKGLSITAYQPETDTITTVPTTHFPPLLSMTYAGVYGLGFYWPDVPAVVSLIGWVVFLSGIGWLTYRLSNSPLIAALVIFLAASTPHFWEVFQHAWSEVLFLPLLVWLMIVLTDLPEQQRWRWRLVLATVLLALLMLTRYVGIFVLAAIIVWWMWCNRQNIAKLMSGTMILACSALPLLAWFMRNALQPDTGVLGRHLLGSTQSFGDGLLAMVTEGVSIFMPTTTYFSLRAQYSQWFIFLAVFAFGALLIFIFWRYSPVKQKEFFSPHRTPIWIFLAFYVSLYTFVQPFLLFTPIDMRDMSTILCLFLPCLGMILAWLPAQIGSSLFIGGYIAANAAFAYGPLLTNGFPAWFSVFPPRVSDVTHIYDEPVYRERDGGLVSYLITNPPRAKSLINNHPEIVNWIESFDTEIVLFTNEIRPILLATQPSVVQPDPAWLELHGEHVVTSFSCMSQYPKAFVVLRWDRYSGNVNETEVLIEQKYPDLYTQDFSYARVYYCGL